MDVTFESCVDNLKNALAMFGPSAYSVEIHHPSVGGGIDSFTLEKEDANAEEE